MKRKWLALLLSCTMVVNTGVLPVAATTLDSESTVVEQVNQDDTEVPAEEGTLKAESNFEEIAEDEDTLPVDLESDTCWTEGEKARTIRLGEENNIKDVFDYAAIAEKLDTSRYQISEIDVTVGENTLKHKVDADNKEDKTTAEEISECFGESFVISEDAQEENFIGDGKVSLAGTAKENVTIQVIFEKNEKIAEPDQEEQAKEDADESEDTQPEQDVAEQASERTLLGSVKIQGVSDSFAFDKTTGEATAYVGTDVDSIGFTAYTTSGGRDYQIQLALKYTGMDGKEDSLNRNCGSTVWMNSPFLYKNGKENVLHITATKGDVAEEYTLTVKRQADLQDITLEDQDGNPIETEPAFNRTTTEYATTVLDSVKKVKVKATDFVASTYPDESKVSFNGTVSEDGTYEMNLKSGENKIVIKAENGADKVTEYTVTIKQVSAITLTVETDSAEAQFCLYNEKGERIYPENGIYKDLFPETDYTYTVACSGYVGQSGTLNCKESTTKKFELEKAADSEPLPKLDVDYGGFRADSNNQSVISAKTPVTKSSIEVKWEKQIGDSVSSSSGSTSIIVDDKLYVVSGTNPAKLYMLDKDTGEVLKSSDCFANANFNLQPATYGDGMIFVPLKDGIQCFNASTLESLWCYRHPVKGGGTIAVNSPIRYENGRVYFGVQATMYNSYFVCLTTTDEDPSNPTEEKTALWTNYGKSYQWSGSWTNDNYVFVVDEPGNLLVMDKNTGETVQKVDTTSSSDTAHRGDVTYYNGRIYYASAGYLYSYNLTGDGKLDLENTIEPLYFGGSSTGTPAIYNNRIYLGISSGSTFGEDGAAILVANIDAENGALSKAYLVPTRSDFGYCQTSGLIINGYEGDGGYVYVYFLVNSAKGSLYMVKDKPGMTEPDKDSGLFYTPNHEQYCIASAVVDKEGTLYLKNDSGWQCAIRQADAYLKNVEIIGGNAVINNGNGFNGSTTEHSVAVDMDTTSVTFNLTPNEGTEVRINGVSGGKQDIALTSDETTVKVELLKGETTKTYTFTIVRGPVLESMRVEDEEGLTVAMNPSFEKTKTEYVANIDDPNKDDSMFGGIWETYVYFAKANETDTVKVTAVSGVGDGNGNYLPEGKEVQTKVFKGETYAVVPYVDNSAGAQVSATVKFTVTSEDGKQSRSYLVTLCTNNALPILTLGENPVQDRTENSAKVTVSANKEGTLYYLAQKTDAKTPDADTIQKDGKSVKATAGENTLDITELTRDGYTVYMILKQEDGTVSSVKSVDLKAVQIKGDMNNDGEIDMIDVTQLLEKLTAGETVSPDLGDINGDGEVDMVDVTVLMGQLTEK